MRVARVGLAVLCAVVPAAFGSVGALAAEPAGAEAASLTTGAPPRTVSDITGVLGAYKPDPQKAAAAKAAADEQPPAGQSVAELAEFYYRRGNAAGQVGRVTQRVDDLRQALALAEKAGSERSRILEQLAQAEFQSSNVANAIRYGQQRIEVDEAANARGRLFGGYRQLMFYYLKSGNLQEAERWVAKLRTLYADMQNRGTGQRPQGARQVGRGAARPTNEAAPPAGGDRFALFRPAWRAAVAVAEAQLAAARGRYREAETTYRTAIDESDEFIRNVPNLPATSERPPIEFLENGRDNLIAELSATLREQGKLVEAELEARRALTNTLKTFGRYHPSTAQRLSVLTFAVKEQGRAIEAERLARANIAIFEAIDASRSWGLASARGELGSALVAQGRWADAAASFDAMMAGLAGDPIGTRHFGFGNFDWVTALIKTGRFDQALAMANRLLEHRRKFMGEQSYPTAFARGFVGMVLAAQGQREPALRAFRDAIPTLLSKPQQSADDGPTANAQRLRLLLDAYIRLLAEIRGTPVEANARIDAAADAFQAADAARGQTVQKALDEASARVTLRDPALTDLARREQDTGQELAGLESTLADALSAPADQQDAHAIDVLRDQINQLRTSRDGLRQEIARRFPDYAQLVNPKPATIEAARAALKPGEALFATYVSDDATFAWAVRQQGPSVFAKAALSRKQLNAAVAQLRHALDPQAETTGEIPRFDVALANELYNALLKPV
ncbi:MAG TPA: tetratricopeptide repeat protein, partial [Candidatus Sulfotelmatobacter sp.]|nr:tetratricopeptide repeat protein [Candidatus Sulfotelmatobacter sp.]